MEPLVTAAVPVITLILTGIGKNFVVDENHPSRTLLVRCLAAVCAIISAVLAGEAVDANLVEMALTAFVGWAASIGLFHGFKKA